MTETPKAVVFDIGNVLVNWDPDLLYAELVPDPSARKALFAEVGLDQMNLSIDCGAPFRETVYATAQAHPHHGDLIRAWHDRWAEMFTPPVDGCWTILRGLRAQGVPVFALSNFGSDSFRLAETLYPALAEFDRRYISADLRVIKPDPRIYQIVEQDSGLSGPELFFIDDRADNIAAARTRGWQGYRFGTPEGLRAELANAGLQV